MPTKKQITELSKKLRDERKLVDNWDEVSEKLYDGKIDQTHLSRIANPSDDHFPKDKAIRDLLIPPPSPEDVSWRVLHILASEPELHEIQDRLKPRERTKKLLR